MNLLKKFAVAWSTMVGLSYLFTAILAPGVTGDVISGAITYSILGVLLLIAITLVFTPYSLIGRWIFLIIGIVSVCGGVMSWTGVGMWNVPFTNIELFQISMAFFDLLAAVFMFILALEDD